MVSAFILGLHAIAAWYAYVKWSRQGGWSEGLLAIAFMAIIFAVGWTIATMLTNLLFTPDFIIRWYYGQTESHFLQTLRKEISRDTISLLILTLGEVAFYYLYLRSEKGEGNAKEDEEKNAK
jgi:hypothetical protein